MAARATLAAHLKPTEWKSDPDCQEQNLLSFDKYCKWFQKWLNITGMMDECEDVVWDMVCMTGGEDMDDLLTHQVMVNMIHLPEIRTDNQAQDNARYVPTLWTSASKRSAMPSTRPRIP